MPERVHPASPTATDLFKNLTEKTGTHTLLYEQKKAKLNNRHSFCRFCTHAIWWAPQRQSNETAPRSGTTCLHNEVIKCIYRQPLNCRSKSWGTPLSPSGSGRHKYSLGFASLLQTEPRKKQCRHRRHGSSSATQAFHYVWKFTLFLYTLPLPMHWDCKQIQAETVFCWCSSTFNNRTVAIGEGLEWYLKAEEYIQYFWAWNNFSKNVIIQNCNLPFVIFNFIPYFQAQLEAIPIHCHTTEKGWSCTRCCYPHSGMNISFPTVKSC